MHAVTLKCAVTYETYETSYTVTIITHVNTLYQTWSTRSPIEWHFMGQVDLAETDENGNKNEHRGNEGGAGADIPYWALFREGTVYSL